MHKNRLATNEKLELLSALIPLIERDVLG
jgi:hypothetical protein